MSDAIETTGPDIDAAVQAALAQLGLLREQVQVEVLEEPSRRLLGLGNKLARVRVAPLPRPEAPATPPAVSAPSESPVIEISDETKAQLAAIAHTRRPVGTAAPQKKAEPALEINEERVAAISEAARSAEDPDQEAETGVQILQTILNHMALDATVQARRAETDGREEQHWMLEVQGQELGDLIGYRGETLSALQYITRLIASNQLSRRANLVIDVEGYKSRREEMLKRLARKLAAQAIERGRTVSMEPMPPHERRIIHLALHDNPSVTTESIGEGEKRKVTIVPKRQSR